MGTRTVLGVLFVIATASAEVHASSTLPAP
jgi:hypothetical protein